MGGAGPSTQASASAVQATLELTKTATATTKYATPTALEVNHLSLNLTLTRGSEVQELTANTNSNVTSAGSFGANEDNSTYLDSTEKSPETKNTNSDLLDLIKETGNIHEVVKEDLEELHIPRVIFNQNNDLDPVDLL